MSTIGVDLTDLELARQFSEASEKFLVEWGRWDHAAEVELSKKATQMRIHSLDFARLISEVLSRPSVTAAFEEARRQTPVEKWFQLAQVGDARYAIIVDRSDSTNSRTEEISAMTGDLRSQFETVGPCEVWDWGLRHVDSSSRSTPPRPNPSLFAPVWATLRPLLAKGRVTHAVVVGSGIIFDLEDFREQPGIDKITFAPVGDSLTGGCLPEVRCAPNELVSAIVGRSHIPYTIRIGSPGAIPIWWDNPHYYFDGEGLQFDYSPGHRATSAIRCGFLAAHNASPGAVRIEQDRPAQLQLAPLAPMPASFIPRANGERWAQCSADKRRVTIPGQYRGASGQEPVTGTQTFVFHGSAWTLETTETGQFAGNSATASAA